MGIHLTHNNRLITYNTVSLSGNHQFVSVPAGPNKPYQTLDTVIPSENWHPPKTIGRLVQISDLHFYENTCPAYYDSIMADIHQLAPDMIAITGDTIHHGEHYVGMMGKWVEQLPSSAQKFAIMGNHDYSDHANGQAVIEALTRADIQVLINQHATTNINRLTINITGIDDLYKGNPDVASAFKGLHGQHPIISLIHNPLLANDLCESAPYKPILVLAGHTHAGHVYIPILKPIYKHVLHHQYRYGFYPLTHQQSQQIMPLYVTSGLGGAAYYLKFGQFKQPLPRFRWNTYPEIAVFDLVE
jgi:predicted MPP superfamily phosphohydrolase